MAKRQADVPPGGFFGLPILLMQSEDFRELSPSALKVLMVLGSQYHGKNNGDLAATHSMMEKWGGMSKGTLAKALRELQERNLISRTRQNYKGRDGARCALFAITWKPIDDCGGKLDVVPTITPKRRIKKSA